MIGKIRESPLRRLRSGETQRVTCRGDGSSGRSRRSRHRPILGDPYPTPRAWDEHAAMNAISAEGLVKVYRSRKIEVRALDGVDLEVPEGTVLGLLGPNGAGKTTTVRILATLLKPDAGHATVAGFDVVKQAQQLRSVIGLSGQYAAVDENLTGRENLEMFGRLYQLPKSEAKRRADELLEQFELTDAGDRVDQDLLGRHAPAARPRQRPHRATEAPVPRRADDGPGPAQPARDVGRHPRPRARGHDAPAHHPVPRGGGRAGRHDRGR